MFLSVYNPLFVINARMKTKGGQNMKKYIKILSMIPIFSLASCSNYKTLSNDQALDRAKEILEKQYLGEVSYNAFTYSAKYVTSYNGKEDIVNSISKKLIRDYLNSYLYCSIETSKNEQSSFIKLWIYKTEGNVIHAYQNSLENIKIYTAYPLSNETIFDTLIEQSKDIAEIEYVEQLTYSQESLLQIQDFYTRPEPREIYQGYSLISRSKGEGSLDVESNFAYFDNEESVTVSEELTIVDYLFSSRKIVNTVSELNVDNKYETTTLRQTEAIIYKANTTYPNLNEFTFVEPY